MKKYFNPEISKQIKENFDNLPIKDFNLYYKFHTIYFRLLVALLDAFEGFAFAQDLYQIYVVFYSDGDAITYQAFCEHLKKMQKENLIAIDKGEKHIVALKTKAFKLFGSTQTDIRAARYQSRSGQEKSQMLAKLHLLLNQQYSSYKPHFLEQDENRHFIYSLKLPKNKHEIFYYLDVTGGKLTSNKLIKNLKEIATVCVNKHKFTSYEINIMSEYADGVQIRTTKKYFEDGTKNLVNWRMGSKINSIKFEK